ncbi:MAG: DUF3019 domain-containing protein [Pseudomonadota bacterium]
MLRILILLGGLLLCCTEARAQSADVPRLNVTPLLCIVDKRAPTCDITFLVQWQSDTVGYYCLFNDFSEAPVRCWTERDSGELNDPREVSETFSYWITDEDTAKRLVAVAIDVLRLDSGDRRRQRRNRHVWDLL